MLRVVGFFEGPHALLDAAQKAKSSGKFASLDAFSPFPIHGMDDAMGIKRSMLPYITFGAGITGTTCAFALQYWTSAVDWPLIVGGKPFNSWPAFVPVMFELTILFAGIATVFGMFALNRLLNLTKKAFDPTITRDRFALMIEAAEGKGFDQAQASQFLSSIGARDVRQVYAEGWF
jgi:hypothetical protein